MAKHKIRHTYAIGDIQGCHDELQQLLERVGFDPDQDRLWLTGDLVSRGPQSAEVLRYVMSLGEAAVTVLGNHDLHLLAAAAGVKQRRLDPSLQSVLDAPDSAVLLEWLRHRPLLHREKRPNWPHEWVLVHAGLAPQWTVDEAEALAAEVENTLRGPDHNALFAEMYGDQPLVWNASLSGLDRLRFIINCMTRMRYCLPDGSLALEEKGAPGSQPQGSQPWFAHPNRRHREAGIVFGHWSTLGQVVWSSARVYGLDGGCVWGGQLIALRIEDMTLSFLPCEGHRKPG